MILFQNQPVVNEAKSKRNTVMKEYRVREGSWRNESTFF